MSDLDLPRTDDRSGTPPPGRTRRMNDAQATFDAAAQMFGADARDPAAIRRRIEMLEMVLERSFVVPGTKYAIGLDAIAGLVPVLGDVVTGVMGLYLVWEGRNLGLPKWKIARMIGNVGIDTTLGLIPFVGDAFDFVFRSNSRNVKIIKRHLDRHHPHTATIDR